jgi:hypothetical protein
MAQIDHVIDARAKEIVGGGAGKHHGRTPRKLPLLEIKLGVLTIGKHLESKCLRQLPGFFRGDYFKVDLDIVWTTITADLPGLKVQVSRLASA